MVGVASEIGCCVVDPGNLAEGLFSMSKGKFYLVTGIGHCGTQWLANALDYREHGVYAIHEGIRWWCPRSVSLGSWKDSVLYYLEHGIDQRFDCYFAKLDELLGQYRVVVDAHSWIPSAVPEVAERVEISGIIHLVRNGIQNVHSLYEVDHGEPRFWFYHVIKREAEKVGFDLPKGDRWTRWCRWWAANAATVDWLREQEFDTRMYRLEDLTSPYNIFTLLTGRLGFELPCDKVKSRKAIDWNRHIMGDRTPMRLLAGWNREQRETFLTICSEAMRHLGYF